MKNNKFWAVLAGVAAVAPLIGMILMMTMFPSLPHDPTPEQVRAHINLFDHVSLAVGLTHILVLGLFIIYALGSEAVPREKRTLWTVVLLAANSVAFPFFWYWYIWCPAAVKPGDGPSTHST